MLQSAGLSEANGWGDSWRDRIYDYAHYHSRIHEVLGIARGTGRVQFGGPKGRTLILKAGDVAILPAGTGHQCLKASGDFLVVGAYPPRVRSISARRQRTAKRRWSRSRKSGIRARTLSTARRGRLCEPGASPFIDKAQRNGARRFTRVRIDQDDRAATSNGASRAAPIPPLTKKRMETVHEEFLGATMDFIDRANLDKKPSFAWFNSTRMHIWTRLKPESQGKTGLGIYPDAWWNTTSMLGIVNNTIVIYTTDNGAETFTWPDGGTTPFRGEKNTNWESSYRVPALVRWPGLVAPHAEINGIFSAEDWVQTCDFTAERQLIMRVRVAICVPA